MTATAEEQRYLDLICDNPKPRDIVTNTQPSRNDQWRSQHLPWRRHSRLVMRGLIGSLGLINSIGTFQACLETLLTTLSVFFIEWGLFVPITYISSYALSHGISTKLSYQLLAVLNAGSFFGRLLPGYLAYWMGRFNTLIVTIALCLICNACLWMPAGDSIPSLIVYCCLFGFASGSNISLTPVCIGQLWVSGMAIGSSMAWRLACYYMSSTPYVVRLSSDCWWDTFEMWWAVFGFDSVYYLFLCGWIGLCCCG